MAMSASPVGASSSRVDVIDVGGPIDGRLISFVEAALFGSDAALVVLKVDSAAALDAGIYRLLDLVADAPVPVAVWVGPAPAVAHGGAAQLLLAAAIGGAAPGAFVGHLTPTVAGSPLDPGEVAARFEEVPEQLLMNRVTVDGPVPGVIDVVSPSIGQFITGLDGTVVEVRGEGVILRTAQVETVDGVELVKPLGEVRFMEPGLLTRALRVTVVPEAALLFLVIGIALIVLEVYAAGPGVAAGAGVLALLMASYGLATLPTNWWAAALAVLGLLFFVVDFQRATLGWVSALGTGLLAWGGLALIDGGDQIPVVWWAVVMVAAGAGLFFGFVLPTLARARFSTPTIGREHLVGSTGVAPEGLRGDGVVVVGGARWRARPGRSDVVEPGGAVTVVGVDGLVLLVEPR